MTLAMPLTEEIWKPGVWPWGLKTSRDAFDGLGQEVIERGQDLAGLGVVAVLEFLRFGGVAACAVARGDDGGDQLAVVLEAVDIAVLGLVAVDAADAFLGVGAALPVVDDGRRGLTVAVDALLAGDGHDDGFRNLAQLDLAPDDFLRLDQEQGTEEQQAHRSDDVALGLERHARTPSLRF